MAVKIGFRTCAPRFDLLMSHLSFTKGGGVEYHRACRCNKTELQVAWVYRPWLVCAVCRRALRVGARREVVICRSTDGLMTEGTDIRTRDEVGIGSEGVIAGGNDRKPEA